MRYILSLFLILFFVGCNTQQEDQKANLFTIAKAPLQSDPIGIDQTIIVQFSQPLDETTVSNQNIFIANEQNQTIDAEVQLLDDNISVVLLPYQFFKPASLYSLNVTTDIRSTTGATLAANYRQEFQTQTLTQEDNTTVFKVRNLHPMEGSIAFLNSEISIDFTKNIALDPLFSTNSYLEVYNKDNSQKIEGHTEVFNSLLKFIPASDLPADTNISVKLVNPISDIYGITSVEPFSWEFTTTTQETVPLANDSHKILTTYTPLSPAQETYKLRTLLNSATSSKIILATNQALELYSVNYNTPLPSKPTITYLAKIDIDKKVNTLYTFNEKYLLVGNLNGGVDFYEVSANSFRKIATYFDTESIYGIKSLHNEDNDILISGPTFGVYSFEFNETDQTLTQGLGASSDKVGETLVTIGYTQDGMPTRVMALDYKGQGRVFGDDATYLTTHFLNGAPRFATLTNQYGSFEFVVSYTSGRVDIFDYNATYMDGASFDLPAQPSDIIADQDSEMMMGVNYVIPSHGVYRNIYGKHFSLMQTGKEVASATAVYGFDSNSSFLVVANRDGSLDLFNAAEDHYAPSISITPSDGATTSADQNITIYISEQYLDTTTLTPQNITLYDNTDESNVAFSLSTQYDYSFIVTLDPDENLTLDHNYTVTVSKNITDLLGRQSNDGNDTLSHFTVQE